MFTTVREAELGLFDAVSQQQLVYTWGTTSFLSPLICEVR